MTMRERYQIAKDEGVIYRTYLDSLNYPTGGIGHLLSDTEAKTYPLGTAIPASVVEQWFDFDMLEAVEIADKFLKKADKPSDELHDIITNMAFNLGATGLSRFRRMWGAIYKGDFIGAAREMKDSLWYFQVGDRSKRLHARMLALGGNENVGITDTSNRDSSGESPTRPESGC